MPSTVNLANYLWVTRYLDLKGEATSATFLNQLNFCVLSTYYPNISNFSSSSKKHLCEADEDHYRNLQLVKVQRTSWLGWLSPADTYAAQLLHLGLRNIAGDGIESSKSQRPKMSAVRWGLLYMTGKSHLWYHKVCLNKTYIMETFVDMPAWVSEIL